MKTTLQALFVVILALVFSNFSTTQAQCSKNNFRIGYNTGKDTPHVNEEGVVDNVINFLKPLQPVHINMIPAKNGGTGAIDNPYIVTSASDLYEIADRVNNGTEASGEIFPNGNQGYAGQYFLMINDLDLSDYIPWPGISIPGQALFYGHLDGDNHSIYNLVTNPGAGTNQGLFTVIGAAGSVKNLTIASGDIKGSYYVGAICGALAEGATIENCHNYCDVTITNYYAGGIAGAAWGNIRSCTNSGDISGTDFVGGIVGDFYGNLESCSNTGDIYGDTSVGGIIGYSANAETKTCINAGNSYGSSGYVGGTIGFLTNYDSDNTTRECLNFGNVESPSASSGAVIGRLWHSDTQSTASDCYYDKQMCSKQGVAPGGDIPGVVEGRFTREMLDNQLDLHYFWEFEPNIFPRPSSIKDLPGTILAAAPIFFHFVDENEFDIYNNITKDFIVSIENGVEWYSIANNIINVHGQNVSLINIGSDTLVANLESATKKAVITITDITTSIASLTSFSDIQLYPVPAKSILNLDLVKGVRQIRMLNLMGQIVKDITVNGELHTSLDLTGLKDGTYILQFVNDKGEGQHKNIIISR